MFLNLIGLILFHCFFSIYFLWFYLTLYVLSWLIWSIISMDSILKSALPRAVWFMPVVPAYYFILKSVQIQMIKYVFLNSVHFIHSHSRHRCLTSFLPGVHPAPLLTPFHSPTSFLPLLPSFLLCSPNGRRFSALDILKHA